MGPPVYHTEVSTKINVLVMFPMTLCGYCEMKTLQQSVDRHTYTLFRGMVITIMCFPVQKLAEERGQCKGHLSCDVVGWCSSAHRVIHSQQGGK